MNKKWMWAGLAVVLVAAGGGAVVMGLVPGVNVMAKSSTDAKSGDKKDVTLEFTAREVARPQWARMASRMAFSGPLVAPSTAVVRAKASGTLLSLAVAEGSRVVAGQTLGRIDLAEQSSRLAERAASVESARATLAQAERVHASNERLAAQKFISPNALDSSRAAVETARATLQAMSAAADTARIGLRDAALVSPIAGIVAKRHALPGEKLAMEQQVLTIVDLARLELDGAVGTHEVSRLAPGMPVQVTVEGVDVPVAGRIARIAPAAEPGTRSIGVTIELANPKERLRAGQYAVARVELADETDRLTLPVSAVGSVSGQDHVWLIESGKLARRAVKLGRRNDRDGVVEVLEGVKADNQVLAARFDNLREGDKAMIVAGTTPAASASASAPLVK
jgi:membrane fusion protein, multidrug efflux system